jgi:hypothetical protein
MKTMFIRLDYDENNISAEVIKENIKHHLGDAPAKINTKFFIKPDWYGEEQWAYVENTIDDNPI